MPERNKQMMTQSTLASSGFDAHRETTRKAAFLARTDKLMPWADLQSLIEPHHPTAGNGKPPRSIQTMLRMCCISRSLSGRSEIAVQ